jgi:Rrf2 family protein
MLSQRARYALRALVYLAGRDNPRPAAIGEIAEAAVAPRKFLEAILLDLRRRHIVASTRGRFGGYALARPPSEITFADVIRALDGPLALAPCASRTAYRPCETCPSVDDCPVHPALLKARDAMAEVLEAWTLEVALGVRGSDIEALTAPL